MSPNYKGCKIHVNRVIKQCLQGAELHPTQLVRHACYGIEPLSSHTEHHRELDNIGKIFLENHEVPGSTAPLRRDCLQSICHVVSEEF